MRAGDTFVTALMPTGLQTELAELGDQYDTISHHGLTRTPSAACAIAPAGTSTRNDSAMKNSPSANLAATDGSRGPSLIHSHANIGARMITKSGGTDWNQDEGNENAEELESRVAVGEEIQRRSRLIVGGPEQDRRRGRR